ncbi:O-phospho-L-seryl-tRNA:Cys-tRNA synthase [Methanopyrus kandleri]|uniref:O-phospho-L-seryl-tRNA:Cys-tRNA synthase n=2 Tax=Methanopyrus kandleri TaxID=2320 RepID=SPSS_METKA|nr:O-phospho-L-seryl-tRNA:Cys-tRNA synthase [Methanopyrus kandleri]Q8TYR3.1 RecName: Full=O-phospho-L-seryl-tRNA:Cys-tRNA synthase; AltName: Full=Sep-tRNA:Cys-tRNA synthase; Short=SepCysS [Methanopyrus kandleri AV19]AAM01446.1 Archaea-specific pyridoxal phosphate-dependent enzyme [Methanopyrus kandleri AV19]HII70628.1 O-phospho-L-seryl-tRNA:Cys-tRNA synthase [Methanopyrus kandleri]
MNLDRYRNIVRETERKYINVNPIQRGGVLTPEARKALLEFGDGYSVCDFCEGLLHEIEKPPIRQFHEDLAEFLGMDVVRITAGARYAKEAVMSALCEEGDVVVADSLAHYTTFVAAEKAGATVREVPNTGHPEYKVKVDEYARVIDEVEDERGDPPALALLTHVDSEYGNLADAEKFVKICRKKGVPALLNCAYTMGRMDLSNLSPKPDFMVGSGHKGMAACAPCGVLAMREEWEEEVLRGSSLRGDVSGREWPHKEVEMLGCTVMGAPIVTMMASFPHVVERVKRWKEEVRKTRWFVKEMERIEGVRQLGERPKRHDLVKFETPGFHEVAEDHPRRGYFLYEELKKRGVIGIQPGQTETIKASVYGLTDEQVEHVVRAFHEIAEEYGLEVS